MTERLRKQIRGESVGFKHSGGEMFRVLNTSTGELAVSLDYYTSEQLDKAFRVPGKDGVLKCPTCRTTVVLRQEFDALPHFLHPKGSKCPHANENLRLLEIRAALYRHLRREFGDGVTVEHDLPNLPRSVDCWVESSGTKIGYWIFEREMVCSPAKRIVLREAIQADGAQCHFLFSDQMLNSTETGTLQLGATEKFAKVCTPYDVLDGQNEGGSLHYIGMVGPDAVLTTFRVLRDESNTGLFTGIKKKHPLSETEVCADTGFLVHASEKSYAEILITRKAREKLAEKLMPNHAEALRRKEWELETRRMGRTNETVREIVNRLLRPRSDIRTLELCREREAPCEFCGVVTRDWIVYTGATGKCKCRTCYERISAEKWKARRQLGWNTEDGKVA